MSDTVEFSRQVDQRVLECLIRSRMYRVLSLVLGPPDMAILDKSRRSELLDDLTRIEKSVTPEIGETIGELKDALEDIEDATEDIRRSYERNFNESTGAHLPLYETEYTAPHIFAKTQTMADIAGFYRAFGMRNNSALGERPDQASAELEFMHLLSLMEANAVSKIDDKKTQICRDAERKFIKDHVGRWMRALGRLVSETATVPFYRVVGQLLTEFVDDEIHELETEPEEVNVYPRKASDQNNDSLCALGESGRP